MNRFFKLLYINLLAMFDINKIKVARESGVKSNLEKKSIIIFIAAIFYGYVLYKFFTAFNITDKFYILSIGFISSTLLCFFINLSLIEPIIFKNDDNDLLFSLPLSKYQILFSKLFNIYLRNLVYVVIIMVSSLLAFTHYVSGVSEELIIMYVLISLLIPLIPIVLATIISYINSYFKVKASNKVLFNIVKLFIIVGICLLLFFFFKDVRVINVDEFIEMFSNKIYVLYPLSLFFYLMVKNESVLFFLLLFLIPIIFIYIYSFLISNNYSKICSMLKGIKKKVEFKYKKTINLHKVFGIVRKEIINLFSNKFYLLSSYGLVFFLSIILFVGLWFIDIKAIEKIEYFSNYFNLYCPTILAMLVTINTMSISSMSLEKDNMQVLRTMPVSIGKVIFGKWLANIILSSIFIIINALIIWYYFDVNVFVGIFNIVLPLCALMFVTLTALVLDYRFICKNEQNDNSIIKQRLITIIPTFLSLVIGIGPFFLPMYAKYKLLLSSYILFFVLMLIVEIIYLLINGKRLIRGLFS